MDKINFYTNRINTEDGIIDLQVAENMCNTFLYPEFLLSNYSKISSIIDDEIENVLDVGCGAGPFGVFFAMRGKKVVAIDINPIAIECCKENVKRYDLQNFMEVKRVGIEDYKCKNRFDMIVCNPPYGDNSYMRKELSKDIKNIQKKISNDIFDAEVEDYLTNCWKDSLGRDMMDYIFARAKELLNPNGKILIICGNDFIDSKQYMINKADKVDCISLIYHDSVKKNICIKDGNMSYIGEKIFNILTFECN